jgi:hypothetical protein
MATWYGWALVDRRWQRLVGPHPSLEAASRALTAEVRRRGLRVPDRHQALTSGAAPPDGGSDRQVLRQ